MALPAHLLERLPAHVRRGEPLSSDVSEGAKGARGVLPLGSAELNAILPDGGLPRGSVVELSVTGGLAVATSLALAACRSAQDEAVAHGGVVPWCAFVDPSSTLNGPGVVAAGVTLGRLLIVRPSLEALERTAIRLAESQVFSVVVVDTMGVPGAHLDVGLGAWPRVVRRLTLGVEGSGSCVILVTDAEARRPLPLPVALRLELARITEDRLSVRIGKERRGRVSGPHRVAWTCQLRSRAKPLLPTRPWPPLLQPRPRASDGDDETDASEAAEIEPKSGDTARAS
jgi:recombination protein RecA